MTALDTSSADARQILDEAEARHELALPFRSIFSVSPAFLSNAQLRNITLLDLSNNALTSLPGAIGLLKSLEELWLNANPIRSLPREVSDCGSLRTLLLADTEVCKLPCELGRLSTLVTVDLTNTPFLKPALAEAYHSRGTLGLLAELKRKDDMKLLKQALLETLTYEVYREEGSSPAGRVLLEAASKGVVKALASDEHSLRMVIRNAGRLFPPTAHEFSLAVLLSKLAGLQRDNMRKQLGADLELVLRALYYHDSSLDKSRVEALVTSIMAPGAVDNLDDTLFLLKHAKTLLPAKSSEVHGPTLRSKLYELRTKIEEDILAAQTSLTAALLGLYPDCDEEREIRPLVADVTKRLGRSAASLRALAGDAAECFPSDFSNLRLKAVLKNFAALQEEKGLA